MAAEAAGGGVMQIRTTVHDERDGAIEAERLIRDELSHIADALGVAPYGGCYEQSEVLEKAKALAKRVEELQIQHLEALERGAQMKVERDHFESEWATASERTEELEAHLNEWGAAILRAHPYDDVEFDMMSDYWNAAVDIATRRAGRASS